MLIGYDRVSTKDRSLDLQLDALHRAECEAVFTKVASGAKAARPVVDEVLSRLRAGDVLLIWKLIHLGRSLKHLVTLATELMERKVGLISLNDPVDATTPQGRLIFSIFASLAEFERDLIRERTQPGLAAALVLAAVPEGALAGFIGKRRSQRWQPKISTAKGD
jgi:DNA invertase Pin-like site-specific DNA recombinase